MDVEAVVGRPTIPRLVRPHLQWHAVAMVRRGHASSTPVVEQDEIVEDDLDPPPLLTRLRVLPAGGMQPARHRLWRSTAPSVPAEALPAAEAATELRPPRLASLTLTSSGRLDG